MASRHALPAARRDLPPFSEHEIVRFVYRAALFERRGFAPERAEAWAARLRERDYERDDRHLCAECAHLQRDGGCQAARSGALPLTAAHYAPVPDELCRCPAFAWQRPS